jgi:Na+-driven multidrug efflux pump
MRHISPNEPIHLIDYIHSMGNLLGENKAKRAGVAANTSIVLAVMIALFWSTLFLIFRKSWALMFNNDPGAFSFRLENIRSSLASMGSQRL